MNSTPAILGADSLTLFILVSAMLCYRAVDLYSIRKKLDQLAAKTRWWTGPEITYSVVRAARKQCGGNTRSVLFQFKLLMGFRQDFVAGMMLLLLSVFAIVGFSVLLSADVRSGNKVGVLIAIATALVSAVASVTNLIIEQVKVHI